MSTYKFKVKTYSHDSTGYYLGRSDELITTVYAADAPKAKAKALALRKEDWMAGTHDAWGAVVLEAEEVSTKDREQS